MYHYVFDYSFFENPLSILILISIDDGKSFREKIGPLYLQYVNKGWTQTRFVTGKI